MDGSCAASVPADGEERKDGRPPAASPTVHDSGTKPDDVFEFLRCARQLKARLADMLKPNGPLPQPVILAKLHELLGIAHKYVTKGATMKKNRAGNAPSSRKGAKDSMCEALESLKFVKNIRADVLVR